MSCHSETGRVGIRRCIEINQRLHFRFTLPYQNRYFDTRPSPVGEVIRLPDLSCVETRYGTMTAKQNRAREYSTLKIRPAFRLVKPVGRLA